MVCLARAIGVRFDAFTKDMKKIPFPLAEMAAYNGGKATFYFPSEQLSRSYFPTGYIPDTDAPEARVAAIQADSNFRRASEDVVAAIAQLSAAMEAARMKRDAARANFMEKAKILCDKKKVEISSVDHLRQLNEITELAAVMNDDEDDLSYAFVAEIVPNGYDLEVNEQIRNKMRVKRRY